MTLSECLAATEIQDLRIVGSPDEFDPDQDTTLRVYQLIAELRKWDPMRPVNGYFLQDGSPLVLDIKKVTNSSGYLQLVVE